MQAVGWLHPGPGAGTVVVGGCVPRDFVCRLCVRWSSSNKAVPLFDGPWPCRRCRRLYVCFKCHSREQDAEESLLAVTPVGKRETFGA